MEKYTKKRMLSLLMVSMICSQQYSNVCAAENSSKGVAIVAAVVLVATGWYLGYQNGLHDGRQIDQDARKNHQKL